MASGAVDYVQPSITKMGGVTQMLQVIELARAHGVAVAPHSAYFGPGLLATMHVCAAQPEAIAIERYFCDLEASPFGDWIVPRDGHFIVPDKPGLGADPDPAVLEKYRVQ
jgi:D-galactarolactone cycloisomerase